MHSIIIIIHICTHGAVHNVNKLVILEVVVWFGLLKKLWHNVLPPNILKSTAGESYYQDQIL